MRCVVVTQISDVCELVCMLVSSEIWWNLLFSRWACLVWVSVVCVLGHADYKCQRVSERWLKWSECRPQVANECNNGDMIDQSADHSCQTGAERWSDWRKCRPQVPNECKRVIRLTRVPTTGVTMMQKRWSACRKCRLRVLKVESNDRRARHKLVSQPQKMWNVPIFRIKFRPLMVVIYLKKHSHNFLLNFYPLFRDILKYRHIDVGTDLRAERRYCAQ